MMLQLELSPSNKVGKLHVNYLPDTEDRPQYQGLFFPSQLLT